MAAGIPGTGINGIFYTALVIVAPLREIPRTLSGKSSATRWRAIGRLFLMTAAVVAVLVGEFWLLAKAAEYARDHWGFADWGLAKAFESVAPRLAVTPFVILAAVLVALQLLRLAMWLRTPLGVRGRTSGLIVLAAAGAAGYLCACAMRRPNVVHQ